LSVNYKTISRGSSYSSHGETISEGIQFYRSLPSTPLDSWSLPVTIGLTRAHTVYRNVQVTILEYVCSFSNFSAQEYFGGERKKIAKMELKTMTHHGVTHKF
jgi:hypothetical protein